jgi:hypothetical protein
MTALGYKDLAPVDDIENGDVYLDALEFALQNERVRNIALAGAYGSGKSSVIETFLRQRSISDKFLKISMASFFTENTGGKNECEKPQEQVFLDIHEIEQGILKQLFYKVEPREIPQSRYRKLHVEEPWRHIFWSGLFLFMSLIFSWVFIPKYLEEVVGQIIIAGDKLGLSYITSVIFFSILFYIFLIIMIYKSRMILSGIKIKGLTLFADVQVEYNESEGSVFNKNLDEIVYFFEKTGYRIIFFEDLDRLNNPKIFVHLRELNYLLNNDDVIQHKPVVFVYAIRDDLLSKDERTKFFDFIIPVIPVINPTNSGDILLKWLYDEKNGQEHDISESFVLDISLYIDDMRLLQNIYNEYLIYKRTLNSQQELLLSDEKMMAMIVFKNLYPSDFADIQMERGIIKQAFFDKMQYIIRKKEEYQEHIDEFIGFLETAEHDTLASVKELKSMMLVALAEWNGITKSIVGETTVSFADIMKEDFMFADLEQMSQARVCYVTYYGDSMERNVDVKDFIQPYSSRWEALYEGQKERKALLQTNLEALREVQGMLSGCLMKDLFLLSGHGEEILSPSVVQNKLLVFLLRRGYIDETYADYINYFKGRSISAGDKNFILAIKHQEGKEFSYPINKVDNVIRHLQTYEFAQKEIYNFDLLEGLLSKDKVDVKLDTFLKQLSDENPHSWKFISEFVYVTKEPGKFIQLLARRWKGMWKYIDRIEPLYDNKLNYLALIVENLDSHMISDLNIDNSIRNIFEEHLDILQQLSSRVHNTMQINKAIKAVDVKFRYIKIGNVPPVVLDYVFENMCYVINAAMIQNVIAYKEPPLLSDFPSKGYSVIKKVHDQTLMTYVHENLDIFVKEVILSQQSAHDELEDIIELLEQFVDRLDICEPLIQCEKFQIKDLKSCCKSHIDKFRDNVIRIWEMLLLYEKVDITWANVIIHWELAHMTGVLREFIDIHAETLSTKEHHIVDEVFIRNFIAADFKMDTFRFLLPILRLPQFDLDIEEIDNDKLAVMIDCNYFLFTREYYEKIYEKEDTSLAYSYILRNQNEFVNQFEGISMNNDLFELIILSQEIEFKVKTMVFAEYAEEYMTENVAKNMVAIGLIGEAKIFFKAWACPLSPSERQKLMFAHLQELKADDFEIVFREMLAPYKAFSDRSRRHYVWLSISQEDKELAKRLKQLDYISSYKEDIRPKNGQWKGDLGERGVACYVKLKG